MRAQGDVILAFDVTTFQELSVTDIQASSSWRALLLGARTLLGAPGIATRNKKLLGPLLLGCEGLRTPFALQASNFGVIPVASFMYGGWVIRLNSFKCLLSFLFLVMPAGTSGVLAPSSDALVTSSFLFLVSPGLLDIIMNLIEAAAKSTGIGVHLFHFSPYDLRCCLAAELQLMLSLLLSATFKTKLKPLEFKA